MKDMLPLTSLFSSPRRSAAAVQVRQAGTAGGTRKDFDMVSQKDGCPPPLPAFPQGPLLSFPLPLLSFPQVFSGNPSCCSASRKREDAGFPIKNVGNDRGGNVGNDRGGNVGNDRGGDVGNDGGGEGGNAWL